MSYPHPKRNFVPKAVLMKTGMRPVNAAKPKAAYNAVKRNRFNDVKASACWVWMPKNRVVDHVSKNISASVTLKRLDYIDHKKDSVYGCINSGEARVQQRKRRIQRRVPKSKIPEEEFFGRILFSKENEGLIQETYDLEVNHKFREDCWELNTSELVLPRDELVLLSQQLVLLPRKKTVRTAQDYNCHYYCWFKITAVVEKLNSCKSLLVSFNEVKLIELKYKGIPIVEARLEAVSIRHIQGLGYDLEYDRIGLPGYGLLDLVVLVVVGAVSSFDGYGVLDVRQ
ncbi:hypothetical protein Tco_0654207 [Tanacetum coccineum]|uniref:Uncharacterized protein n=1 Tax=Tanacetum coccineum TaxID=301880 RepID=A0ABQ4X316_9ASTR